MTASPTFVVVAEKTELELVNSLKEIDAEIESIQNRDLDSSSTAQRVLTDSGLTAGVHKVYEIFGRCFFIAFL